MPPQAIFPTNGLYLITPSNPTSGDNILATTKMALAAGVQVIQYRNKQHCQSDIGFARELYSLCTDYSCHFIVNDDLQLATSLAADGIHIGKNDISIAQARAELGPHKTIGVSCYNSLDSAIIAQDMGADYLAFGCFYPSLSKPDAKLAQPSLLQCARQHITLPIVAIGGITPDNSRTLLMAGADLLAVISCIYHAADPARLLAQFNTVFSK